MFIPVWLIVVVVIVVALYIRSLSQRITSLKFAFDYTNQRYENVVNGLEALEADLSDRDYNERFIKLMDMKDNFHEHVYKELEEMGFNPDPAIIESNLKKVIASETHQLANFDFDLAKSIREILLEAK